jgi:ABC-type multidrug transport system ATPase subunit
MIAPRIAIVGAGWATDQRYILLDVSLSLNGGELVALTGPNGAGKSTLLDLLAGTRTPTRGRIELDGVALPGVAPAHLARRIARLDHKPGLYLDLSAHENIMLFAALLSRPLTAAQAAARLASVGIQFRDQVRAVRTFSRGMLQRTALARVQASGADIWLLDEPSTGLDVLGVAWLVQVLGEARQRGVAVLLATHDPALLPICDRRVHLDMGMLAERDGAEVLP